MKNILFGLVISLLVSANAFAQNTKDASLKQEVVDKIIVRIKPGREIELFKITLKNVRTILGKPLSVKTTKGEVEPYRMLTYPHGKIYFDGYGKMDSFEISDNNWAFVFNVANVNTKAITIGTDKSYLTNIFRSLSTYHDESENPFFIKIREKSGSVDPYQSINLNFRNGVVSAISYVYNND